ncbi:MAG: hypothetical protein LBE25_13540 [Arthrobacter sp.]|nr:hypothetical protein [Arthrobacter sp.]
MTPTPGTCTTPDCGRAAQHYLCPRCINDLDAWLNKIPETMTELFTTMARLDNVTTGRNGSTPTKTDTPAPVRFDALDVRAALHLWNHRTAASLATDPHAGNFLPLLQELLNKATQLIDLPPDELITVAPCQCGEHLEARPDYTEVTCPTCGLTYQRADIDHWRTNAITAASEPLNAADTVAWVNERARKRIKPKDLTNWVARGRIRHVLNHVPNNLTHPERHYLPGEVLRVRHRHLKV